MGVKRIGVLTSGGDAPGMNAAVRAVVRSALHEGMEVLGSVRGYNGLIHDELIEMSIRSVTDTIHRGGTSLFTARSPEFRTEEGMQKAVDTCKRHGIEGVVVIGGDGSFRGARDLTARGIPCIGVPATIDNDISCTEVTIGYDTATNTVVDMADKLRDTSQSHDRCSVVEVMGRHAGWIALYGGIAGGADVILLPEIEFTLEDIVRKVELLKALGQREIIIVVSEGATIGGKLLTLDEETKGEVRLGGIASFLSTKLETITGIETRYCVLGHVQRGGNPSARDRVLAARLGHYAVQMLKEGKSNRVVAVQNEQLVDYDITEALDMKKPFDMDMYRMANEISG